LALGPALEERLGFRPLLGEHSGNARLQNAGLFGGDLLDGVAEKKPGDRSRSA